MAWVGVIFKISAGFSQDLRGIKQEPANMSLLELGLVIFGGIEAIVTFMRNHGLLVQSKNCAVRK